MTILASFEGRRQGGGRPAATGEAGPLPGAGVTDWPLDIAFLGEAGIDPTVLEWALERSRRFGVTAAEVLIRHGVIGEDAYYRLVARRLGLAFLDQEALRSAVSTSVPVGEAAVRHGRLAALSGNILGRGGAVAPQGEEVDRLARLVVEKPHLASQVRIATPTSIRRTLGEAMAGRLTATAREGLARRLPHMSALAVLTRTQRLVLALAFGVLGLAFAVVPGIMLVLLNVVLALVFLAVVVLRLLAVLKPAVVRRPTVRMAEQALPDYTILVPLHDEAEIVPSLVGALRRLDYPPERLDIKLVVEADDAATRAAIDRLGLEPPFETVVVPASEPRTKPKALSYALPLARGAFVVVYDAEDRPDPDQLRLAVATFDRHGPRLACLQARLDVDRTRGNWLAEQFATEYAGQFHVILPFLALLRLPLPLGGTSNHFRREALERIGGWDPFNVTEDADIGQRLARFGYRAAIVASSTMEEAPDRFGVWLRQRTRWMKGWMQTYLVHMRSPRRLLRDLNPFGFLALQVMVGGMVLSALVHPVFLVAGVLVLAGLGDIIAANGPFGHIMLGVDAFNLVAGYAGGIAIAALGLERRGARCLARRLASLPVYWVLISLAAYRALYQLWRDPFRWEKTPHAAPRPEEPMAPKPAFPRAGAPVGRVRRRGSEQGGIRH